MTRHGRLGILASGATGALAALMLVACSTPQPDATPTVRVGPSDFAAPGEPAVKGQQPPVSSAAASAPTVSPQNAVDVVVVMGAPSNPLAASSASAGKATSGSADAGAAPKPGDPARPDERLLVDQLVGQINGRPVFANEFFSTMDARMRQMAREMNDRKWLEQAKKEIDAALWDKLRDQLLLAEFESALTPEQKLGLFAYIASIRSDLISGNLGSEAQANERLLQTEQTDLDTKVADISRQTFIREQLRKAIASRVQVSYWDVRLYYDQHLSEFMPPPIAKFVVIQASLSDEAKIERIEKAMIAGESFREIAARESAWRPSAGNGLETVIKSREYAQERYFGPDTLNYAVEQLSPGGVTDRIDVGGNAWWVMLAEIEQPPGRSLYDVQNEIERRLRSERWREEEIRYFEQLFQRGSFSDVKQMSARLLQFGAERYLIQDRMVSPPPDTAVPVPLELEQPGAASPEPAAGAR